MVTKPEVDKVAASSSVTDPISEVTDATSLDPLMVTVTVLLAVPSWLVTVKVSVNV